MYKKVSLYSFDNGKVKYCATFGSLTIKGIIFAFFSQTLCYKLSLTDFFYTDLDFLQPISFLRPMEST